MQSGLFWFSFMLIKLNLRINFFSGFIYFITQFREDYSFTGRDSFKEPEIALTFTHSFLIIIAVCLLLPFILKAISESFFLSPMDSAKDLFTTTASVLSGPFGFIVGFYFKQTNQNG